MIMVKRNIWAIFYLLVIISTLGMIHIAVVTKKDIEADYAAVNSQSVEVISNSLHSILAAQEGVLNLLGAELVKQGIGNDRVVEPRIFTTFLELNTSIAALGLITPEGRYRYISSNADLTTLPNLLEQPESRDTFLQTLASDKMVLGRTYFFKPIKKWVIPIRKAIKDNSGKTIAVIAAALDLSSSSKFFNNAFHKGPDQFVKIVRNFDFYVQYASSDQLNSSVYNQPIEKNIISSVENSVEKEYSKSKDALLTTDEIYISKHRGTKEDVFSAIRFDHYYDIWTSANVAYSVIKNTWIRKTTIYFSIFSIFLVILFILFSNVAHAEKKVRDSLISQANRDFLTGLPNRNYLRHQVHEWIHDKAEPFSLLYIDMDNFKNVNDSYGHVYGDQVLKEIADRIQNVLEKKSMLVRHGGDEFLIFSRVVDDERLLKETHDLLETLLHPFSVNGHHFILGASVGIAKYPDHGSELDALIFSADMAMYQAKKHRNKASLFVPGMEAGQLQRIRIEQELRTALKNQEVFMVYQPQVDSQGNVCGAEALVRWDNRNLGFVPPDQFITVAEKTGQMSAIGDFIIASSIKDIAEVNGSEILCPSISINISVQQFMQPDFTSKLFERIDKIDKDIKITLEITESLFIEDLDYVLPILERIHDKGVMISLDDFGTGYSSLGIIKKLPLDELKIDKSFVEDILTDDSAQKMIKNIIDIGKNLNLVVLAEGVETREQKEMLESFGCDRFQGYYFSKPLKKSEFIFSMVENDTRETDKNFSLA